MGAPGTAPSGGPDRLNAFVATAAHEQRTPLASLYLTVDLLRAELERKPPDLEAARMPAERAVAQTARSVRVAGEVLDLSRFDAVGQSEERRREQRVHRFGAADGPSERRGGEESDGAEGQAAQCSRDARAERACDHEREHQARHDERRATSAQAGEGLRHASAPGARPARPEPRSRRRWGAGTSRPIRSPADDPRGFAGRRRAAGPNGRYSRERRTRVSRVRVYGGPDGGLGFDGMAAAGKRGEIPGGRPATATDPTLGPGGPRWHVATALIAAPPSRGGRQRTTPTRHGSTPTPGAPERCTHGARQPLRLARRLTASTRRRSSSRRRRPRSSSCTPVGWLPDQRVGPAIGAEATEEWSAPSDGRGFRRGDLLTPDRRVIRRLGDGGPRETYMVETSGRGIAVAMLPRPSVADDVHRLISLRDEGRAVCRLVAPAVPRYLETILAGEHPHVLIECVPGPTLRTVVGGRGALPTGLLASLGRDLARGVRHRARRLGPSRRQAVERGRERGARLLDFELARPVASAAGISGPIGT